MREITVAPTIMIAVVHLNAFLNLRVLSSTIVIQEGQQQNA